jgi:translocation protein SEC66
VQDQAQSEKEWWEKRRAVIQTDFMKELDESEKSSTSGKAPSEEDAVLVDAGTPSAGGGGKKKKGKK